MTIEEVEARVEAAYTRGIVPAAGHSGVLIDDGVWTDAPFERGYGCCAVGAALLDLPAANGAAETLGIAEADVEALMGGFDGGTWGPGITGSPWYALGVRLRNKWLPRKEQS